MRSIHFWRESNRPSLFLDAVSVAALALMVAVTLELGFDVLLDWRGWVIPALSAVLVIRCKVNAAWIVLGSALLGWALSLI